MKKNLAKSTLSLLGTLAPMSHFFCCALPAILVSVGGSTVIATSSLTTKAHKTHEDLAAELGIPGHDISMFMHWMAEYKDYIFIFSGITLLISGYIHYRPQIKCTSWMTRISVYIFWTSVLFYLYGITQTYILE